MGFLKHKANALPTAFSLIVSLGLLLSASAATSADPVRYVAEYTARANGLSATAYRELSTTETGEYILSNSMTLQVLGAALGRVRETSLFDWRDGGVVSRRYEYEQSGIRSRSRTVFFDWESGIATSTEDGESWELPLSGPVYDQLNVQYMVRQLLGQPGSAPATMEFSVADGDEIEHHLYQIAGEEVIATELGPLDTVRIERVREGGSRRSTTMWLAKDWGMLIARFLQIDSSGAETELVLNSATLAGEPVIPLSR